MEIERIIQDTLTRFIQSHIPAADLSGMDDVFFSYITGVLEELGSPESSEETFDMDTFVEMMEAYIPGFAEIHSGDVCEMMFSLSERLGEARNKEKLGQKAVESRSEAPSEDLTKGQEAGAGACNGERLCTLTDGAGAQEGADLKDGVELLLEMFPACTVSQAEKALAMALGNLEEAVQLIVEEKVEIGPAGASVKAVPTTKPGPQWRCGWHPFPPGVLHQQLGSLSWQVSCMYALLCYSHTNLSPPRNWHGPAEHPTMRN
ncbi:CUE domain-containing protein 2 isoform X2 [Vidua macroura]|uniref:CUE domain-containing protein 2 isoform X2 n=1 Tax=Vidua macroura TaxID=187451 RepID=UPI0023A79155|nr:CUE domain-containing protein 2 isoform X2 [Vidua macroura]